MEKVPEKLNDVVTWLCRQTGWRMDILRWHSSCHTWHRAVKMTEYRNHKLNFLIIVMSTAMSYLLFRQYANVNLDENVIFFVFDYICTMIVFEMLTNAIFYWPHTTVVYGEYEPLVTLFRCDCGPRQYYGFCLLWSQITSALVSVNLKSACRPFSYPSSLACRPERCGSGSDSQRLDSTNAPWHIVCDFAAGTCLQSCLLQFAFPFDNNDYHSSRNANKKQYVPF